MELGLSRTTAVALFEKIARDDLTKAECITWIDSRKDQLEAMEIPKLSLLESSRDAPPSNQHDQLTRIGRG